MELIKLFGSKARGDFDEESDIDVLVVIKDKNGHIWDDLVALEVDLMLKYNVVISSLMMRKRHGVSSPTPTGSWRGWKSILLAWGRCEHENNGGITY